MNIKEGLIHPMQPVALDARGVLRFKKNAIVEWIHEERPTKIEMLNTIMAKVATGEFTRQDAIQYYQLLGVSVGMLAECHFVNDSEVQEFHGMMERAAEVKEFRDTIGGERSKLKPPSNQELFEMEIQNIKRMAERGADSEEVLHALAIAASKLQSATKSKVYTVDTCEPDETAELTLIREERGTGREIEIVTFGEFTLEDRKRFLNLFQSVFPLEKE